MLYTYNSLFFVAVQLRDTFASSSNDKIKYVVLTYSKPNDNLHLHYFEDVDNVTPFSKDDVILTCYYAPKGDWEKWYGDEWCWFLTTRRIALDIRSNSLLYNSDFAVDRSDVLPSWLRTEIDGCF